jgi:hypothetical protein
MTQTATQQSRELQQQPLMGISPFGSLFIGDTPTRSLQQSGAYTFRLSLSEWKHILKLGQSLGWLPMGAVLKSTLHEPVPVITDYRPGDADSFHARVFQAADAINLAKALSRALDYFYEEEVDYYYAPVSTWSTDDAAGAELSALISQTDTRMLLRLINFLNQGAFVF